VNDEVGWMICVYMKYNIHSLVLQKEKERMSSPPSSKMLPPYAKIATHLMVQFTSPHIHHHYAQISHNLYVDDEVVARGDHWRKS